MSDPMTVSASTPEQSLTTDAVPSHRDSSEVKLRFRTRVLKGDSIPVGPGKIALLLAVDECRSISAAAKLQGMSYRRAWLLIDEMNRTLKAPVIATAKGGANGGGSILTDFGQELVDLYTHIETRAHEACKADIQRLLSMVAP